MCQGNIQNFLAGLGFKLLQKCQCCFGLGMLLLHRCFLNGIIQFQQGFALCYVFAFRHHDVRDHSRHLGVQIDVFTRGLVTLYDSIRINAFCIRILRRIENGRLRLLLLASQKRTCHSGQNAENGNGYQDLVSQ